MARKSIERCHVTKAQLNSVSLTLQTQAATSRVASVMGKSTAIMKSMNVLKRMPEISGIMRRMGEEMTKAGIIEEMMEDAMEAAEPADVGEEAEEVTAQVLWEVTGGLMGTAPMAPVAGGAGKAAVGTGASAAPVERVAVAEGGEEAPPPPPAGGAGRGPRGGGGDDGGGAAAGGAGAGGGIDATLSGLADKMGRM
jgi:hypothetical protein